MIIVKLEKIIKDLDKLKSLSKIKMPIKASYAVSKLFIVVSPDVKIFFDKRDELLKSLGEQDGEDSEVWIIKKENEKEWEKNLKDLLDIDIKIDIEKININDLGNVIIEPELVIEWLFRLE